MVDGASAPLRVDLTGGYTDVRQVYERLGGVALNIAIDYRTLVFVAEPGAARYDGLERSFRHSGSRTMGFPERLLLHAGRILGRDRPLRVAVHAGGPTGCGLGSSGSLAVAVVALVAPDLSRWETVQVAQLAEAAAGNDCGIQDQVAATYGAVNAIELPCTGRYSPPTMNETQARAIEEHCTLWLKEAPRHSGSLVEEVLAKLRMGDRLACSALRRLCDAYPSLREALFNGKVSGLIESVREVHSAQVALQAAIVPHSVQRLVGVIEERFGGAAKLQGGGGPGAALLVLLPDVRGSAPGLERLMAAHGYRSLRLLIANSGILKYEDYLSSARMMGTQGD